MKIIHCADVHLGAKMTTNLSSDKAGQRKAEILETFLRIGTYAEDQDIHHVIIAGDLFDTSHISANVRTQVMAFFTKHPAIHFYYLCGNHDSLGFLENFDEIPDNLHLFDKDWKYYPVVLANGRQLVFAGVELDKQNASMIYPALSLDAKNYNIVILHGMISGHARMDDAEVIDLSKLKDQPIDYLALGHIHEFRKEALFQRGTYCYPGCLEGRGYDEAGKKGFVVLDLNEETMQSTIHFVPFAYRTLFEVPVDIHGCVNTPEIQERIQAALKDQDIQTKDMVEVVLQGEIDVDCQKDITQMNTALSRDYYFARVKDNTSFAVDYSDYAKDASLKGEFVRLVENDPSLSAESKAEIIRCGFQALNGEEIK